MEEFQKQRELLEKRRLELQVQFQGMPEGAMKDIQASLPNMNAAPSADGVETQNASATGPENVETTGQAGATTTNNNVNAAVATEMAGATPQATAATAAAGMPNSGAAAGGVPNPMMHGGMPHMMNRGMAGVGFMAGGGMPIPGGPMPGGAMPIPGGPMPYGGGPPAYTTMPLSTADPMAMQFQRLQQMQDWMLNQKDQECAKLKEEVEKLRDQNQELRVENALLKQKLSMKDERLQQELKYIRLAAEKKLQEARTLGSNNDLSDASPEFIPAANGDTSDEQMPDPDVLALKTTLHPAPAQTVPQAGVGPKVVDHAPWGTSRPGGVKSPGHKPKQKDKVAEMMKHFKVTPGVTPWGMGSPSGGAGKDPLPDKQRIFKSEDTTVPFTYKEGIENVASKITKDSYGDQGHFTGEILKFTGLPHGHGKMEYDNGNVYDGDWVHGRWDGTGHALFANNHSYKGQYKGGSRHGQGCYMWSDGRVYEGGFDDDKRHGKGKLQHSDGRVEQGIFKHNTLVEEGS